MSDALRFEGCQPWASEGETVELLTGVHQFDLRNVADFRGLEIRGHDRASDLVLTFDARERDALKIDDLFRIEVTFVNVSELEIDTQAARWVSPGVFCAFRDLGGGNFGVRTEWLEASFKADRVVVNAQESPATGLAFEDQRAELEAERSLAVSMLEHLRELRPGGNCELIDGVRDLGVFPVFGVRARDSSGLRVDCLIEHSESLYINFFWRDNPRCGSTRDIYVPSDQLVSCGVECLTAVIDGEYTQHRKWGYTYLTRGDRRRWLFAARMDKALAGGRQQLVAAARP